MIPILLTLDSYVFGEYAASLPADTLSNPANRYVSENGVQADCERTIPTYLALFIFAFVFDIAMSWDAIRLQNTIQV